MKCSDVREYILTDYLDERMSADAQASLERHLAECVGCREFEAQARRIMTAPFRQAERLSPPEGLWEKIHARIVAEQGARRGSPAAAFWAGLKERWALPKPAFAAAALVGVVAIALTFTVLRQSTQGPERTRLDLEAEAAYVAVLLESTGGVSVGENGENGGFGTAIEEYFL